MPRPATGMPHAALPELAGGLWEQSGKAGILFSNLLSAVCAGYYHYGSYTKAADHDGVGAAELALVD